MGQNTKDEDYELNARKNGKRPLLQDKPQHKYDITGQGVGPLDEELMGLHGCPISDMRMMPDKFKECVPGAAYLGGISYPRCAESETDPNGANDDDDTLAGPSGTVHDDSSAAEADYVRAMLETGAPGAKGIKKMLTTADTTAVESNASGTAAGVLEQQKPGQGHAIYQRTGHVLTSVTGFGEDVAVADKVTPFTTGTTARQYNTFNDASRFEAQGRGSSEEASSTRSAFFRQALVWSSIAIMLLIVAEAVLTGIITYIVETHPGHGLEAVVAALEFAHKVIRNVGPLILIIVGVYHERTSRLNFRNLRLFYGLIVLFVATSVASIVLAGLKMMLWANLGLDVADICFLFISWFLIQYVYCG